MTQAGSTTTTKPRLSPLRVSVLAGPGVYPRLGPPLDAADGHPQAERADARRLLFRRLSAQVILAGHGTGKASAVEILVEELRKHHPEVLGKVAARRAVMNLAVSAAARVDALFSAVSRCSGAEHAALRRPAVASAVRGLKPFSLCAERLLSQLIGCAGGPQDYSSCSSPHGESAPRGSAHHLPQPVAAAAGRCWQPHSWWGWTPQRCASSLPPALH